MCSPSIRNNSIAFAIATRWPGRRMIGGMPASWRMPWPPIARPFADSRPKTRGSSSCGKCPASTRTSATSCAGWPIASSNSSPDFSRRCCSSVRRPMSHGSGPCSSARPRRAPPRATVRHLLTRYRIRRVGVDDVVTLLRTPALPVAPGTVSAAQAHLTVLLPRLRLAHAQRATCGARLDALLEELADHEEHRDVSILRSLPGVGRAVAATMLAEASRLLAARDYHGLRAHSGVAPVTKQSGKRALVVMRQACNPRLRDAAHYWGQSAVRHEPHSQAHYARLRTQGHSHGRALRGVVDRLLRVLMAMLTTQTLYDPARRMAAHA